MDLIEEWMSEVTDQSDLCNINSGCHSLPTAALVHVSSQMLLNSLGTQNSSTLHSICVKWPFKSMSVLGFWTMDTGEYGSTKLSVSRNYDLRLTAKRVQIHSAVEM